MISVLSDVRSQADRKVPLQPYIIERLTGNGTSEIRINKRKLFELPFHLLKCKNYDLLKETVFFNFEYLFATLKGSSASTILDEFEIFMKADKQLRRDPSMKTLFANLAMIRPYLNKFPDSLSYELSGRLTKFITQSPLICSLIRQCDAMATHWCPVVPMLTCFDTADLGLRQNISYRTTESFYEGGTLTCCRKFKTLYILDSDDSGAARITVWDVDSAEMIHEILVVKEQVDDRADIYIQMVLDKKEEHLIAFHKGTSVIIG